MAGDLHASADEWVPSWKAAAPRTDDLAGSISNLSISDGSHSNPSEAKSSVNSALRAPATYASRSGGYGGYRGSGAHIAAQDEQQVANVWPTSAPSYVPTGYEQQYVQQPVLPGSMTPEQMQAFFYYQQQQLMMQNGGMAYGGNYSHSAQTYGSMGMAAPAAYAPFAYHQQGFPPQGQAAGASAVEDEEDEAERAVLVEMNKEFLREQGVPEGSKDWFDKLADLAKMDDEDRREGGGEDGEDAHWDAYEREMVEAEDRERREEAQAGGHAPAPAPPASKGSYGGYGGYTNSGGKK